VDRPDHGSGVPPVTARHSSPRVSERLGPIIKGFLALGAAAVIGQAIGFVVLVFVAHRVGPENLGAYAFAQNFAMYFEIPIDFGITMYAVREVSREPERLKEIIGEVMVVQLLLLAACVSVTLLVAPQLMPDTPAREILPIIIAGWIPTALSLDWALRSMRRMNVVAGWRLAGQVLYGVLALLLIGHGLSGIKTYAWLNVVGAMVTAVGLTVITLRQYGASIRAIDVRGLGRRYARAVVVGASLALAAIYYSSDAVVIGYLRDEHDVGLFSAAYKIPMSVIALGTVWLQSAFPYASALVANDSAAFRNQLGRVVSYAGTLVLPVAVGGSILAPMLMVGIFGEPFRGAAAPFALLIWSAALALIQVHFTNGVLALGDERYYLIAVVSAAVLNIGLDLALVPSMGPVGAAIATLVAESVMFYVVAHRIVRRLGAPTIQWRRLGGSVAAALAMAAVLLPLRSVTSVWICLVVGGVVYSVGAVAFGAMRPHELRRFRRRNS